jgi:hypothetical protein
MGAAFFYSPNSVGVLFPDYFEGMSLTIFAFILAMVSTMPNLCFCCSVLTILPEIQFCLEEWQDGYFVG